MIGWMHSMMVIFFMLNNPTTIELVSWIERPPQQQEQQTGMQQLHTEMPAHD